MVILHGRWAEVLFLISCTLFWSSAESELQFDNDGNLLDDGLSRALSHSPEGSDLLIDDTSTTPTSTSKTTTSQSQSTTQATNGTSPPLFDILNQEDKVVVENVVLNHPESDKVRMGSVLQVNSKGEKVVTPEGGNSTNESSNSSSSSSTHSISTTPKSSSILEDYEYLSFPQGNKESAPADGEAEDEELKPKKAAQMMMKASSDKANSSNATKNTEEVAEAKEVASSTTPGSIEATTVNQETLLDSPNEKEEEEKEVEEETKKISKSRSLLKTQNHNISSLVPCFDTDPKACKVFKPLCNIQLDVAFHRCQKTCGFCRGRSLVYEANISKGMSGLVHFEQFFPGETVYLTSCFDKSDLMKFKGTLSFVIHRRKKEPSEDQECPFAGAHWNPYGTLHGNPLSMAYHHQGDLGNAVLNQTSSSPPGSWPDEVSTCSEDHASFYKAYTHIDLFFNPPEGLIFAVHKQEDDYGENFLDPESRKTGQVGPILACGLIRLKNKNMANEEESTESSQDESSIEDQEPPVTHPGLPKIKKKSGPKVFENGNLSAEATATNSESLVESLEKANEESGVTSKKAEQSFDSSSVEPVAKGVRELPLDEDQNESLGENKVSVSLEPIKKALPGGSLGRFVQERSGGLKSNDASKVKGTPEEVFENEEEEDEQRTVKRRSGIVGSISHSSDSQKEAGGELDVEEKRKDILSNQNLKTNMALNDKKSEESSSKSSQGDDFQNTKDGAGVLDKEDASNDLKQEVSASKTVNSDEKKTSRMFTSSLGGKKMENTSTEEKEVNIQEDVSKRTKVASQDGSASIKDGQSEIIKRLKSSDQEIKKRRISVDKEEGNDSINQNDLKEKSKMAINQTLAQSETEPAEKKDEGLFTMGNEATPESQGTKTASQTKFVRNSKKTSEEKISNLKTMASRLRRTGILRGRVENQQ